MTLRPLVVIWHTLVAVLLVGCVGVAPTPQIVYVTPAPTPVVIYVTPAPPTVRPTPTEEAFDDQQIAGLVRAGLSQLDIYIADIQNAPTLNSMVGTYSDMGEFAGNQQASLAALNGSSCIQEVVDLWNESMILLERLSDDFLEYVAGGAIGDFNSDAAYDAGAKAGQARNALDASSC